MKKTLLTVCAAVGLALASCSSEAPVNRPYNDGINIIPMPAEMQVSQGSFKLTSSTVISANTEEALKVGQFFADKLAKSTGFNLKVVNGEQAKGIVLSLEPDKDVSPSTDTTDVLLDFHEIISVFFLFQQIFLL